MNGEICVYCKRPMMNSNHRGSLQPLGKDEPMHKACADEQYEWNGAR